MTGAGPDVASVAASFGDLLHRAGVATTPERSARFAEILELIAPIRVDELYWGARVAFVIDRSSIAAFDRVFAQVFRGAVDVVDAVRNPNVAPPSVHTSAGEERAPASAPARDGVVGSPKIVTPRDLGGDRHDGPDDEGTEALLAAAAAEEVLAATPFDQCTPEELAHLGRLMARLVVVPPMRASRRTQRHRHGDQVHWRATLRRAHRTGGDPIRMVRRRRRQRQRRVVLIADVSGSMEDYARAYLYLLHGAVRAVRAEAFVFATRLSRLTRVLAEQNPELALQSAKQAAPDWSGGTRIGAALHEFNSRWGRRGLARGAVIVIVSDGWEAGDVSLLAREMERLSRLSHRIVWVNPRRQSERYQPLTGGMAAALPFVDVFVSGHSLDRMDEVLRAIAG